MTTEQDPPASAEADDAGPASPLPAAPPDEPTDEPTDEHADDGLDLALALTRATARLGGRPARRRRPQGATPPEGRASAAHPDDRDPQLVDATLGRLVAERGWALELKVHGLFGRWDALVGAEVAQHSTPESFADGRLLVRTDSTAWATQLRLLAPTIVRRLNDELGPGTVTALEVVGPHLPTWKKGRRSVRDGRGPRDTYG